MPGGMRRGDCSAGSQDGCQRCFLVQGLPRKVPADGPAMDGGENRCNPFGPGGRGRTADRQIGAILHSQDWHYPLRTFPYSTKQVVDCIAVLSTELSDAEVSA